MRAVLILFTALLLAAPASLVLPGDSGAEAAARKARKGRKKSSGRSKRRSRRPRKPEIKLRDTSAATAPDPAPQTSAPPQRGPTRIDFDDRLVQGQTNRSGSVYLYERKELKTHSMVKKRESFREEIVEAVYDTGK